MRFAEQIADELNRREDDQREYNAKCDDEHGQFATFLLWLYDNREQVEELWKKMK
jgi:hypothetical protein